MAPARPPTSGLTPAPLLCLGLAALPLLFGIGDYGLGLVISALILAGVALAWAMLGTLGGMVSFGHAAFFGVGAYASALLAARLGLPVLASVPLGAACAALSALLMLPALRLSGPYFALAILAYAQIFRILATEAAGLTGGAAGLTRYPGLPTVLGLDLASRPGSYGLLVAVLAACCWAYAALRASSVGLGLRAIAANEDAARVVGVDSLRLKALVLLLSAFVTGLFGALNAHVIGFLEPDYAFSGQWSLLPIVAGVFGGARTLLGPVGGAVAIYLFDQVVAKAMIPVGHQILLGLLLMAMVIAAPDGLLGLRRRRREAPPC